MIYRSIFWLEDHPDILKAVARVRGVDLKELLNVTTFAYDLDMAQREVENSKFQLHILDADFPDRISALHLTAVNDYLLRIRKGGLNEEEAILEDTTGSPANNFARFYLQKLDNSQNIIVFSASSAAPAVAYHLGLPFYSKGSLGKDGLKSLVERHFETDLHWVEKYVPKERVRSSSHIRDWECGNLKDMALRYLV